MSCFLQCTAGANLPMFIVVYNAAENRLEITSSQPLFADLSYIEFEGTGGNGTTNFVTFVSPTVVYIEDALVELLAPTTLSQLRFYTSMAELLGTWIGSAEVEDQTLTIVEVGRFAAVVTDCNIGGPPCQYIQDGETIKMAPGAVVTGDDSNVAGALITFADASTVLVNGADFVCNPGSGVWYFWEPGLLEGKEVESLTLLDSSDLPLAPPSSFSAPRFTMDPITVSSDGDSVVIAFAPQTIGVAPDIGGAGVESQVLVTECSGGSIVNQIVLYNPNGPEAFGNPPGAIFNQWDDTGINVTNIGSALTTASWAQGFPYLFWWQA